MLLEGTEGTISYSPYFRTPTVSNVFDYLFNPYFKSAVYLCVDGSNHNNLQLSFDKRQFRYSNDNYTNLRVTVNGQAVHPVLQVNNSNADDASFSTISIDLSAYDGQIFTLGIEGSHRYKVDRTTSLSGSGTFVDNLSITGNTIISSIESFDEATHKLYPNPTSDWVQIDAADIDEASIQVYNSLGQSVGQKVTLESMSSGQCRLHMRQLTPGMYFIQVHDRIYQVQKIE